MTLSKKERAFLLKVARSTVSDYAQNGFYEPYPKPISEALLAKGMCFTTIKSKGGELRGCMGVLEQREIILNVVKSAYLAAFEDPRFYPVRPPELPHLSFEISILTPFKEARPEEVIPGKHGIMVEGGWKAGLLLPQVATENSMGREEFLEALMHKAGMSPKEFNSAKLYVFEAEVFSDEAH
ncbi:MAG: AmmeMemoRadiSam system protein A [Candidatus Anstonellales archaeon]